MWISTLRKSDGDDPHQFRATPPDLLNHQLFTKGTSALLTAHAPKFPSQELGGNPALERHMAAQGLKFEPTEGGYGDGPEPSYIVHNPTREQAYHLGHMFGQEVVVFGQDGKHEMLYSNGPNAGKYHPSLPLIRFSQQKPEDYYTHLPGKGYVTLHFDWDKLHDSPIKNTLPVDQHNPAAEPPRPQLNALKSELRQVVLSALRKAFDESAPRPHPHAYPWHEGHTSYHQRTVGHGVLLTSTEFMHRLSLAKKETLSAAHDLSPQTEQQGSNYPKYAAPFGSINTGTQSDLQHYPMGGTGAEVDKVVKDHGYSVYYGGGKHGRADLHGKNYDTGHLMLPDPSAGTGGDPAQADATNNWRKLHELAHALTSSQVNQLYGEGRRKGGLVGGRSVREAKRAVHWEHLALYKQRELAHEAGINIPDEAFNREYSTVMHDAVHRAITGQLVEPSAEGFVPHSHQVPLATAQSMVDEASRG